jgi:hypothetical protein
MNNEQEGGLEVATAADIRAAAHLFDQAETSMEPLKEDRKEALADLKRKGLRPDAVKSALKLRGLEAHALRAWFETFEAVCAALNIDPRSQLDLMDSIHALKDRNEVSVSETEDGTPVVSIRDKGTRRRRPPDAELN